MTEGGEDEVRIQTLIPAKIVLTSTMNEALGPFQPKRKMRVVENTDGRNQDGRD